MKRLFLPLLGPATVVAALGCASRNEPLVIGEGYSTTPTSLPWPGDPPPAAHGGGPRDHCHDPDLELDDPEDVPEGFEEGDDSPISPAHPPHLKKRGVEDNI